MSSKTSCFLIPIIFDLFSFNHWPLISYPHIAAFENRIKVIYFIQIVVIRRVANKHLIN